MAKVRSGLSPFFSQGLPLFVVEHRRAHAYAVREVSTTTTHYVAAAALLERLLTDARFRSAFRKDPAEACRNHGLDHLAVEFEQSTGPVLLEARESRSTLAGVLLAAAWESAGILEWLGDAGADAIGTAGALERALAADPRAMPVVQLS